jgi:hypothetical protein
VDKLLRSQSQGAIELPLYCAQVEDSENQGKNWWLEGCPAGDSRAQTWERRRRCYDLVLDSLGAFSDAAAKVPPAAPGAPADGIEAVRSAAYEFALGADDEAFHSTLYDWLIERGLADELLDVGFGSIPYRMILTPPADEATILRGAPATSPSNGSEVSASLAILRKGGPALTCRGESRRACRVC